MQSICAHFTHHSAPTSVILISQKDSAFVNIQLLKFAANCIICRIYVRLRKGCANAAQSVTARRRRRLKFKVRHKDASKHCEMSKSRWYI